MDFTFFFRRWIEDEPRMCRRVHGSDSNEDLEGGWGKGGRDASVDENSFIFT